MDIPPTHLRLARRDEVLGVEEGLLDGLAAAERAAVPQHHHLDKKRVLSFN